MEQLLQFTPGYGLNVDKSVALLASSLAETTNACELSAEAKRTALKRHYKKKSTNETAKYPPP